MTANKPKKLTLVEDAYEQLRDQIQNNKLAPGYQAPEAEIALQLGMSRTPVREALLRLEAEGFVSLIPRRGVRILPISANDMREIYEILICIESDAAARLARAKLSSSKLEELVSATNDMEIALKNDDLTAWAQADNRFHHKLLELNGNRRLLEFARNLEAQSHRARMITIQIRNRPVNSVKEHRAIIKAIRAGNEEKARSLFSDHRKKSGTELLQILEKLNLNFL